MKKLTLLLAVGALAFNSCTKDLPQTDINNISTQRKAILFKFGSTTCGACIAQEIPMKTFLKNNPYQVYGISVLQDYYCTSNISWQFNYSGIPAYTEGSRTMFDTTSSLTNVQNSSSSTFGSKADVGIGVTHTISGNTVSFKMKSVLFNDLSGDYNFAVYVLENHADTLDDNTAASYPRDHVYRGAASNKIWGEPVIVGGGKKGDIFEHTMIYNLGTKYTNYEEVENLEFIAIIYKVENNRGVEIMNCNKSIAK